MALPLSTPTLSVPSKRIRIASSPSSIVPSPTRSAASSSPSAHRVLRKRLRRSRLSPSQASSSASSTISLRPRILFPDLQPLALGPSAIAHDLERLWKEEQHRVKQTFQHKWGWDLDEDRPTGLGLWNWTQVVEGDKEIHHDETPQ